MSKENNFQYLKILKNKISLSLLSQITKPSYCKTEFHINYMSFPLRAFNNVHPLKWENICFNKICTVTKFKYSTHSCSYF